MCLTERNMLAHHLVVVLVGIKVIARLVHGDHPVGLGLGGSGTYS